MDSSNPLITPETDGRYFRRSSLDRDDYPLSARIAARPSSPRRFSPSILVFDPRPPFPSLPFYFLGDGRSNLRRGSRSFLSSPFPSPSPPFFHYLISPRRDAAREFRKKKRQRRKERERERERFEEERKVPGRKKGFNYSARRNVLTRCTGNRLSSIYLPAINI